ncbi:hypothetical protein A2Z67_06055 [Candidatus Woesebacteria bacterium RBG_13_36_22]|uniref:Uncharacterized protein n=1 Tax=Candidatus Woesebacteria bacterium RBG_13_36_22 TaxID=1802478 RepID=A0A1F7X1Y3_9BACT|nr:MAG: hypothetical protein A2Z67_06055 [Candidatus Woesebacteria bacterium RBG_13_36_22]
MKRMRKQVSGIYNEHNLDIEPGQRLYSVMHKKVFDIIESTGKNKKSLGELTPIEPIAQRKGKTAIKINNIWYWK